MAQFTQINDGHSRFIPAAIGNYLLRWTAEGSAGCPSSSDEIALTIVAEHVTPTTVGTIAIGSPYRGGNSSNPSQGVRAGGWLYFVAEHRDYGPALWRTDSETTHLVIDLNPGSTTDNPPRTLTAVDDRVFFGGNNGALWVTQPDGGATFLLNRSEPHSLNSVGLNGKLYFKHEQQIWVSDGTPAGTVPAIAANGSPLGTLYGALLFYAEGDLWLSDGTTAGSFSISLTGDMHSFASPFVPLGANNLFFAGRFGGAYGLWKTDGTAAGTSEVTAFGMYSPRSSDEPMFRLGSLVFFTANDGVNGRQLWRTDGSSEGTYALSNISPGLNKEPMVTIPAGIFYTHNGDLYMSDGSRLGTRLFMAGRFSGLFTMGDRLFMRGSQDGDIELWQSDGTVAGTVLFKDLEPEDSSYPAYLGMVNDQLLFSASSTELGRELWKTDGTPAGTILVKDIAPQRPEAGILGGTFADSLVYWDRVSGQISVTDGIKTLALTTAAGYSLTVWDLKHQGIFGFKPEDGQGYELWRTDGTQTGSYPLLQDKDATGVRAAVWGDQLALLITHPDGVDYYLTDGTPGGTVHVTTLGSDHDVGSMSANEDHLYFVTRVNYQSQLYMSDGTAVGTVPVNVPAVYTSNFPSIVAGSETLYFWSEGYIHAYKNQTITRLVAVNSFEKLIAIGDRVVIVARNGVMISEGTLGTTRVLSGDTLVLDSIAQSKQGVLILTSDGREIVTDGTLEGSRVTMLFPDNPSANPGRATATGQELFFMAQGDRSGYEIWRTDATCRQRMTDLRAGAEYEPLTSFYGAENTLYFVAYPETGPVIQAMDLAPPQWLDPNFTAYVAANHDNNGDGIVDRFEAASVSELDLRGLGLFSLEGIEVFSGLERLQLGNNPITDLSPLLEIPHFLSHSSHLLDSEGTRIDSAMCVTLATLETRALSSGATIFYHDQGGLTFTPHPGDWPQFNVTELLGGAEVPPYSLNCEQKRSPLARTHHLLEVKQ